MCFKFVCFLEASNLAMNDIVKLENPESLFGSMVQGEFNFNTVCKFLFGIKTKPENLSIKLLAIILKLYLEVFIGKGNSYQFSQYLNED